MCGSEIGATPDTLVAWSARRPVLHRLWDLRFDGKQLAGQQYFSIPDHSRCIANIISGVILEGLTRP
jgi:hypothetical protein